MKKLHRAHEALSQSDGSGTSSVKTLSASFGTKWPYKRTMSAPASMIPRQDTKQGTYASFMSPYRARTLHPPTPYTVCYFFFVFRIFHAEKEKVYSRQYSAPILKRKSSRFGLGQLLGSTPLNNSIPGRVVCMCLPAVVIDNINVYAQMLLIVLHGPLKDVKAFVFRCTNS